MPCNHQSVGSYGANHCFIIDCFGIIVVCIDAVWFVTRSYLVCHAHVRAQTPNTYTRVSMLKLEEFLNFCTSVMALRFVPQITKVRTVTMWTLCVLPKMFPKVLPVPWAHVSIPLSL